MKKNILIISIISMLLIATSAHAGLGSFVVGYAIGSSGQTSNSTTTVIVINDPENTIECRDFVVNTEDCKTDEPLAGIPVCDSYYDGYHYCVSDIMKYRHYKTIVKVVSVIGPYGGFSYIEFSK